MKLYNYILTAILLIFTSFVFAGERDAIFKLNTGCTGFVTAGHYLVTAKHCGAKDKITFQYKGKSISGTLVHNPQTEDGPLVYDLDPGKYESLPVAKKSPAAGTHIHTSGYPSGGWCVAEGKVLGQYDDHLFTNHRINPGQSGGPLLNDAGQVVGISLAVSGKIYRAWSQFATTEAIRSALVASVVPEVVVFSLPNCGACQRLEADHAAGKFPGYKFIFVKYNGVTWSNPNLVNEFQKNCKPPATMNYPVIWVRSTSKYTTGYGHKAGLLDYLKRAVAFVIEGVIGEIEHPRPSPEVPGVSAPAPIGPTNVPASNNPAEPISPLWGLLGLASGFLHRRYGG